MFFWHMWDSNISQCPHNTSHTSCLVNCPPYSGPRVTVSSPARRDVAEGECGVKRRLFLNSYLGASRLVFFMDDSVRGWAGWDAVSWVLGLAMRWRQAKLDIVWDTDGGLSLPVKTSRFIKIVPTTAMSSKSTDSRQRYYKNKDKDQSVSNIFSDVSLLAGEFEWVSACDSCIVQHVFTHDKL